MKSQAEKRANYRYYRRNRDAILEKQRKRRLEQRDKILARRRELYRQKKKREGTVKNE